VYSVVFLTVPAHNDSGAGSSTRHAFVSSLLATVRGLPELFHGRQGPSQIRKFQSLEGSIWQGYKNPGCQVAKETRFSGEKSVPMAYRNVIKYKRNQRIKYAKFQFFLLIYLRNVFAFQHRGTRRTLLFGFCSRIKNKRLSLRLRQVKWNSKFFSVNVTFIANSDEFVSAVKLDLCTDCKVSYYVSQLKV
jgi:hypothetical protein